MISTKIAPASVMPRRPSIKPLIPRAIGFSFGDDEPEAQESSSQARPGSAKMSSLGTLHGSLLVFSSVLKGAVGEAFLAALAITAKYQATNKDVLAAFGKFYSLLLQGGFTCPLNFMILCLSTSSRLLRS